MGHTLRTSKLADTELPDRYAVLRHIADGGMASVWCAYDATLSRKVAIKVLAPRYQHDQRATTWFEREARAAARLSGHRNIVTIYDVGAADAPAFIVMEYLPGGTVADAIRLDQVSREQARTWIHEAAAALDYAHGRGIVHGDIKPGNLLLDSARVLHVADFGIAQIAEETITNAGQLLGTAAYISPEQAAGERPSPASDCYALAVVAFELLVGERPFDGHSFVGVARRHIEQPPPRASLLNPDLPRTVDLVLGRGLAKEPEARWPSAAALASALDAALFQRRVMFARPAGAALPMQALPVGAGRRVPRGRLGALAALAAVALVIGAAVGIALQGKRHSPARRVAQISHAAPAAKAVANKPAPKRKQTPKPASPAPSGPAAASLNAPASAASLESNGHSLLSSGNYTGAIPVLEQALQAAAPGSINYQYALFDLGHAYQEEGNLPTAVSLLQRRLRYPFADPIVQKVLTSALRAEHKPAPARHRAKKAHGAGHEPRD